MSHFNVYVFSHDGDYESLLAPYCETDEHYYRPEIVFANFNEAKTAFEQWKQEHKLDKDVTLYHTVHEWLKKWHGYEMFADGSYGYLCNPNARWDWYSEDGRFGFARLKKDIDPDSDEDVCIKHLDTSVDEDTYQKKIAFWESYVERRQEPDDFVFYKPEYFIEMYRTKENYARICSTDIPCAFITPDGEWHERGRVGWFGVSDETPESINSFEKEYLAFVNNPKNANLLVACIDCHI